MLFMPNTVSRKKRSNRHTLFFFFLITLFLPKGIPLIGGPLFCDASEVLSVHGSCLTITIIIITLSAWYKIPN